MPLCALPALPVAASILPALTTPEPTAASTPEPDILTAPSLHAVAAYDPEVLGWLHNGFTCRYTEVSDAMFLRFGTALGEAGYVLTAEEFGENGEQVLLVEKEGLVIRITNGLENGLLQVAYPPYVEPASPEKYTDYQELKDGDSFLVSEGVTARLEGWEEIVGWEDRHTDPKYLLPDRTRTFPEEANPT